MRVCLCLLALAVFSLAAADKPADKPKAAETVHGKLIVRAGQPPAIETPEHQLVQLDGDQPTRKVLHDPRVNGFDVEAHGHFTAPGQFLIDPQHTRSLLVHDHDKLKMITYWCDVCYIRAYAPGPCVCCQKDTEVELRDLDDIR
ncbi:MAG: hypothetical protein JWP63_6154 [Candidatus Solibacter sp.]|nr:hypothetical protein [Candidatus Solibacter sp.]